MIQPFIGHRVTVYTKDGRQMHGVVSPRSTKNTMWLRHNRSMYPVRADNIGRLHNHTPANQEGRHPR